MAKIIWPVLVLAGAVLLATAPLTVSGTFDFFSLLTTPLNATSNSTNSTAPAVFNASLMALVGRMNEFKVVVARVYNKTLMNNSSQPKTTNLTGPELPGTLTVLGFTQILPIFNQLASNVVTIVGNNMRNMTTRRPSVSVYDFLNTSARTFNFSLDTFLTQLSFNSTPNATVPAVFRANLNRTATLLGRFLPISSATFANFSKSNANVLTSVLTAVGVTLPVLNDLLKQAQPLLPLVIVPGNLSEVLDGLAATVGSITKLGIKFLPANVTLVQTDPNWDYTCGTFFTDNLKKMTDLWSQTGTALIGLLNSTTDPKFTAVSATIRGVGTVLPILSNLTGQVGVILDGLTPKYDRRLFLTEVRLNRYKSDCHLRHLKRVNTRRLG